MVPDVPHVIRIETLLPFDEVGAPGAYAINTWHASYNPAVFDVGVGVDDCADGFRAAIIEFWNYDDPDYGKMGPYMGSHLTGEIQFKWWDLDGWLGTGHPLPSPGIDMPNSAISGSVATDCLPTQVAICFTTKCDPYGGHNRQSFYNRQYIGPLSSATLTTGGRPNNDVRHRILGGGNELASSLDGIGIDDVRPCVLSSKHATSGLTTNGWVDNRFDIQRRRALEVTDRFPA